MQENEGGARPVQSEWVRPTVWSLRIHGWTPGHRKGLQQSTNLFHGVLALLLVVCFSNLVLSAPMEGTGAITAIWANDGGDKVTRDELRASFAEASTHNSVWDGQQIRLFSAINETVSTNIVIEAANGPASGVKVVFSDLTNTSGHRLRSDQARPTEKLFDWTSTEIELFYIRYLQIKGLSQLSYGTYDERHIPERLRRPSNVLGKPIGGWNDRPAADKFYPDIAVPIELVHAFDIPARSNQSIWVDIYVPGSAAAGNYSGEITISEQGRVRIRVPVRLQVLDFALPDVTTSRTMVAMSYEEVARRYTGRSYPTAGSHQDALTRQVIDRQFMLAKRHRISLIDDNAGAQPWPHDRPRPDWIPRLTGKLFSRENGYSGPGEGIGSDVFVIGLYGAWKSWWGSTAKDVMQSHASAWELWFQKNFPGVDRFVYLSDESEDYAETEKWAKWLKQGIKGHPNLATFATADLVKSINALPSLSIFGSWIGVGDTPVWEQALQALRQTGRRLFCYNGLRPASGSFAIEDDAIALRELPWGQYKMGIDRWFYWNANYYSNYQGNRGDTNVFVNAQTFGGAPLFDPITGMTGPNSSNGDGVLFYPGTDALFTVHSYGLAGPLASLRLKIWRRGIQDVEYIALAEAVDRKATWAVIERTVPKVLWQNGVGDARDPTWVLAPVSWSTNPDDWEAARKELTRIIKEGTTR